MTEGKRKRVGVKKGASARPKSKKAKRKGKSAQGVSSGRPSTEDQQGRTEQLGTILNRTLDLVEASIGLGANLVAMLGTLAQEQIAVKTTGDEGPESGPYRSSQEYAGADAGSPFYQEESGPAAKQVDPTNKLRVTNRQPLSPENPVRLSFSINNDSSAPMKLRLDVEALVGENNGFHMERNTFSVRPAEKTISPMDFEKFILTGKIPKKVPTDYYNGWIRVSGEEDFKIPVTLIVTS